MDDSGQQVSATDTQQQHNALLMQRRVSELETEVKSFGQKRAYFMDIYKRKEGLCFDCRSYFYF